MMLAKWGSGEEMTVFRGQWLRRDEIYGGDYDLFREQERSIGKHEEMTNTVWQGNRGEYDLVRGARREEMRSHRATSNSVL